MPTAPTSILAAPRRTPLTLGALSALLFGSLACAGPHQLQTHTDGPPIQGGIEVS